MSFAVDEDVFRFEVTVDDAVFVEVVDDTAQLGDVEGSEVEREVLRPVNKWRVIKIDKYTERGD